MTSASVLVVGAGPVGLTLACELQLRDVAVRIIDAAPAPTDKSKAIGVHARTLEALDTMGIAARFVAAGRKVHGINAYADGARIVHVSLDDIDSPYSYVLSVPQSDTERLLTGRLREFGADIERDVRLAGLSQDAEGVTATLIHESGKLEITRVGWLVGCDGPHSAVRHALGVPFEGVEYEEEFVLGDMRIDWALPDDEGHAFLSPNGGVLALPMPRGRWRVIAEGSLAEPTVDHFADLLWRSGAIDFELRDPGWMSSFHIHRRVVPRYRVGRVFLAGDAAHIHSPVGGQGMNTGMQDAFNLGWKLALVEAGAGRDTLLESYDAERRPVAEGTIEGTDLATKVVTLRHPIARGVRNRLAGLLSGLEVIQKRILAQASETAVGYRASPIVDEATTSLARATVGKRVGEGPTLADWVEFGSAPHPGDHAPDVPIDGEKTLFDLIRHTRSTLLLFDGAAPTPEGYANLTDIARRVRERWDAHVAVWIVVPRRAIPPQLEGEKDVLLDPRGALHRRYGSGSETLYLIRPDGYVGFRSQPATWKALEEHLSLILC
jgi:2-polyprenyl-6-methoxyphenol hydroxylase-like FAD-dependent oxidoreductase